MTNSEDGAMTKSFSQWTMMPGRGYDEQLFAKDNDARTGL